MKRGKHDHLSAEEREAMLAQIDAGVQTKLIARAFNIQPRTVCLYRAGSLGRVVQSRARRQDHNGAAVKRLCIVGGCEHQVRGEEKRCEQHRKVLPVMSCSEFVKPPTLARLMAGR